jgi:hypothetical protein
MAIVGSFDSKMTILTAQPPLCNQIVGRPLLSRLEQRAYRPVALWIHD